MKPYAKHCAYAFVLGCVFLFGACEAEPAEEEIGDAVEDPAMEDPMAAEPMTAMATLQPTEGNDVQGTVQFMTVDEGVRIVADITGLETGEHGIHIHEFGDCSAPDASSAGGHFAPEGSPHGAPTNPPAERHTGDFGNLEASDAGEAHYERVDEIISLEGPNAIVGKAVIVHAQPDDLTSQPSGDAGARVACGVIQMEGAGMPMDTTGMPTDTAADMP